MLLTPTRLTVPAALLVPALAAGAPESVPVQGKALHDQHCLGCHDTSVYTRADRMIHTAVELEAQVSQCAAGPAEVDWDRDQIRAVARYLGETFYGF
jgi:mono/diheme cytochrome c family protein